MTENKMGLNPQRDPVSELVGKEIRLNYYGSQLYGTLCEDNKQYFLSNYITSDFKELKNGIVVEIYRIESDSRLPIPNPISFMPEKLSDGGVDNYLKLLKNQEGKLEKKLTRKPKITRTYEQFKKAKAEVNLQLISGNSQIGVISALDNEYLYLKPYISYDNIFFENGDEPVPRIEKRFPLPISINHVIAPQILQDGYMEYLVKMSPSINVKEVIDEAEKNKKED